MSASSSSPRRGRPPATFLRPTTKFFDCLSTFEVRNGVPRTRLFAATGISRPTRLLILRGQAKATTKILFSVAIVATLIECDDPVVGLELPTVDPRFALAMLTRVVASVPGLAQLRRREIELAEAR